MGSAFGAGAGADMLQEVLRRKFTEALAQQKLNEDIRQANMQHQIQQQQLGQGQQRIGIDQAQVDQQKRAYDEAAPMRTANLGHVTAETADLQGRPGMAEAARAAAQAAAQQQRDFTGGQNDMNRQNAVRIAGIQGQNALRVANVNHPPAGAQTPQQQNEVADSLNLIEQIANDPALNTAVGPIDQYVGKARDLAGVNRFEALNNQLVGKLSLAQAGKLKGQGQISDKERQLLKDAATALTRGLSEPDYRNELLKIKGQFERMQATGGAAHAAAPAKSGFTVVEIK